MPNSLLRVRFWLFARTGFSDLDTHIASHGVGGLSMPDQTTPLAHVVAQMVRPRPAHRLLFAYDELMAESVIRQRCPDPVFICTARLTSRRFIVNSDDLASIVPR